jgi:hypothetical protein
MMIINLAALSYGADAACPTSAPRQARSYPIEIISNKPFVQVRIDGSKPRRFLLDTGSAGALIDPALAKSLGFVPKSTSEGNFGVGNSRSSIAVLEPPACQEMADARTEAHLVAFDLSMISQVEGVPVFGTVGSEFFNAFVVRIDYEHSTVRVLDPSFDYRGNGVVLPIEVAGQIFVNAKLQKRSGETVEGRFILDTGTRTALSLNSPFVREHHLLDGETAIPLATLGVGMGGESLASVYRIRKVELGPLAFHDVVATASHDEKGVFADPKVAGIIGGELLRKFSVIFDYPHRRLIFEKTPQSDSAFGYDASGLFLLAEGAKLNRIKVLRVVAGSPAEEAGLRKDDVILKIDGSAARNLEAVRELFRRPQKTYNLELDRAGKITRATLRTEDLLTRAADTRTM